MEVDEGGCVDTAGKSPHKGSCEVPVTPVNVSMMITTTAMNKDLTLTTAPAIANEALHCQQLLQAEKDAVYQKTRYDVTLGFFNVANIICCQDLLDKMSTAKLTEDALTKAETEYKAALQRISDLGLCPLVNCGSRHSSAKLKSSNGKNKRTAQADDFILPTKKQTAKIKVQNVIPAKDIIKVNNGFDQLTVDETDDGEQAIPPEPKLPPIMAVLKGLPPDYTEDEVLEALAQAGHKIDKVRQLTNLKSKANPRLAVDVPAS
ncbi:hypothetical protein CEXT_307661 [Caerostris extrusa]|uniref:Uncharacterized protein n=1 Tax=Caerostris extrusa TaxID=172846 RepID=A0AAV4WF04_CAEEX|nr:hypothetical protein CEXT_307661 [Caerostris extrusa]